MWLQCGMLYGGRVQMLQEGAGLHRQRLALSSRAHSQMTRCSPAMNTRYCSSAPLSLRSLPTQTWG